jgi:hypothetical protein
VNPKIHPSGSSTRSIQATYPTTVVKIFTSAFCSLFFAAILARHTTTEPNWFALTVGAVILSFALLRAFDYGLQPFPVGKLPLDPVRIAVLRNGQQGIEELTQLRLYLASELRGDQLPLLSEPQKRECRYLLQMIDFQLQALGLSYGASMRAWRCFVMAMPLVFVMQMFFVYASVYGFVLGLFVVCLLAIWHLREHQCVATSAGKQAIKQTEASLQRLTLAPTRAEFELALALFGWAALLGTELDSIARVQHAKASNSGADVNVSSCGGGCGGD